MKTLVKDFEVNVQGSTHQADLLLGLYASSFRPCLVLVEHPHAELAREAEILAVVTTNPPPGYLTGFPHASIAVKTWSENKGLWEQLSDLADSSGTPFFRRVEGKDGYHKKITLNFVVSPIYCLNGGALEAYQQLLDEMEKLG